MPFFTVTGKMIDYNSETKRFEKYEFTEVVPAADSEAAAVRLLRCWRTNPNTNCKVLNPKVLIRHIKPFNGPCGMSFTKRFLEVVDAVSYKLRSVTTRLNDRSYRH